MSNKFISKGQRNVCVTFVKYYPVLMQVIMLAGIFDEFYPFSITNWLYPILGHSLSWDLFLLAFSRMFRFCIWHRLLIYSMIFNICVEWVTVNIEMPIEHNIVVWSVMAVTLLIIIASIVLGLKQDVLKMKEILTETLRKSGAAVCDKIKEMFLSGECDHLTANDLETWTQLANPAKYYTGEEAVSCLNVTSKRFYEYRKAKLVPDPVKIKGFPKPLYTKVMLDEAIKTISGMSEREIYMRILNAKSRESRAKERRGA